MSKGATLDPYQEIGAAFLAARSRALLADEQGLGKTWQAIRAVDHVITAGLVPYPCKVVLITPASLRDNWRREIDRVSIEPAAWSLFHFSYEGATSAIDKKTAAAEHIKNADVVILDESHYLKTPSAARTKSIFPAIKNSAYIWCLTGTPCPNHPGEIWTHLWHLAPERLRDLRGEPMREYQFEERFCRTINTNFGRKAVGMKPAAAPDLAERLNGFMLRRKKTEVLKELPPIRFGTITLRCPSDKFAELKEFGADWPDGWVDAGDLPPPDEDLMRMRRMLADAKVDPLVSILKEELADPDYKVVIFGHHKAALERIFEALELYEPAMITGDTPIKNRQKEVDRFQRDKSCQVFIGNIKAAGTGLTLTAAANLVFLELNWTPGENAQAAMRVHRKGQTKPVLIRTACLAGTIDEAVVSVLARKTAMLAELGLDDEIKVA